MTPDDPRHGTHAGYKRHRLDGEQACDPCRAGNTRYHKALMYDHHRGIARKLPVRGARRRVQALMALGWPTRAIGREAGVEGRVTIIYILDERNNTITRGLHDKIVATYDRLSMRIPPAGSGTTRARNSAARKGYVPPLAWDDIDHDEGPFGAGDYDRNTDLDDKDIDEAVIIRVLNGENLPTNKAEREEIMRRWLSVGGSGRQLCKRMGWKEGRYRPTTVADAGHHEADERLVS